MPGYRQLVAPNNTGIITIKMTTPGTIYFACPVPSHCSLGMIVGIVVSDPNGKHGFHVTFFAYRCDKTTCIRMCLPQEGADAELVPARQSPSVYCLCLLSFPLGFKLHAIKCTPVMSLQSVNVVGAFS